MLRPLFAALALAGPAAAEPLAVATDIPPVQSLVAMVWTDIPVVLAGPGTDPHDFQFRPSQVRTLSRADILFTAGDDLIPWLAEEARAVNGALDVQPLGNDGVNHGWLDPVAAAGWLDRIEVALIARDPDNAATYRDRAAAARTTLAALNAELDAILAEVVDIGILVDHDAYGALAERYGLDIVAAISDSDAHAPGTAHIGELADQLDHGEVDCILAEPGEGHDHADMLAGHDDIEITLVDPLGHGLAAGPDLYPAMMRNLATAIATCVHDGH